MVVKIYSELCNGCGTCVKSCPCDVIRIDEETKKAYVKYPEDCMLCELCTIDCPTKAIHVTPEKYVLPILSWR